MKNPQSTTSTSHEKKQRTDACFQTLEVCQLLCWLCKDLGWVLYIRVVAWPAFLVALVIETKIIITYWHTEPPLLKGFRLAALSWLAGNGVWMIADFCFDTSPLAPGKSFPWFREPFIGGPDADAIYQRCSTVALFFFGAALTLIAALLARAGFVVASSGFHSLDATDRAGTLCAAGLSIPGERPQDLAFGFVSQHIYQNLFMAPWIAKDICWVLGWPWPCFAFDAAVGVILVDCYRRYGCLSDVAEFLWACASFYWAWGELMSNDAVATPRWAAGFFLLAAIWMSVVHIIPMLQRERPTEFTPLSSPPTAIEKRPPGYV